MLLLLLLLILILLRATFSYVSTTSVMMPLSAIAYNLTFVHRISAIL